jgi:hypothetical protein
MWHRVSNTFKSLLFGGRLNCEFVLNMPLIK